MRQEIVKGFNISKQAIDKRINSNAVKMLRGILDDVIGLRFNEILQTPFKKIVVTDSTSFQLPACLDEHYHGFGGNHGKRGGAKVQYQLALTDGDVNLTTTSATKSDNTSTIIQPKQGELHLFDLGYASLNRLMEFENKKAYFLCRVKINTNLWIQKQGVWNEVTWCDLKAKCKNSPNTELQVWLGKERLVKVRLFVYRLDEKTASKKRKDVKRYAQRHGRSATKNQLIACDFSIHISNIPEDLMSADNANKMYSLRWQIEIQFKTWKSFMSIHKVHPMNKFRFECHHYGTLIYILLCTKIFTAYKLSHWNQTRVELSELKAYKFLSKNTDLIWTILFKEKQLKIKALSLIYDRLKSTCVKEVKKGAQTPMNIISNVLS